jgi:hypothetical protein
MALALIASIAAACGGSTTTGAPSSSSGSSPTVPDVPDGYQPDEKLPLDQGKDGKGIALDAPCGAGAFTPRAVLGSLPNRVEVDYLFEPHDGGANTPAKLQLQLDTTAASCTLGNEGNVGASGGLAADVVNVRGIFLLRTGDGVHDLRIPATLVCENQARRTAAPSIQCNVFGRAPAANQHGSFVAPATATSDAFYTMNGRVGESFTLTWESGRQDLDDAELASNIVELGTIRH